VTDREFVIVPYVKVGDEWSLNMAVVAHIFRKMDDARLTGKVFYDELLKNDTQFLYMIQRSDHVVNMVFEGEACVAVTWLNRFGPNYAYANFVMFPEVWGPSTKEIGKKVMDYWFGLQNDNGQPIFDVLIGETPAVNRLAVRYIKQMGWTILGTIPKMGHGNNPDKRCGNVISYIEREE